MSGRADANSESSKNTHLKSEINKLSTNKGCHFLEVIGAYKRDIRTETG
jgi:hypothetical protein